MTKLHLWVVKVLKRSPNISDLINKNDRQLNLFDINETLA